MSDTVLKGLIISDRYRILKKIGSGSYGIVYLTQHIYTEKLYAIKMIMKRHNTETHNQDETNKQLLLSLENQLYHSSKPSLQINNNNLLNLQLISKYGYNCKILKEIALQLRVHKHPNILSIYKVYDNPLCLFVVMDYYEEGDLFQSIVDKKLYQNNPHLIKSVFIQLIDAINYCHSHHIYHCDLKPENILVSQQGHKLVIADFGLAMTDEFISSSISCGSSYYMAPERNDYNIDEPIPTKAGDIWSLSIILINLISIRNPWLKASFKDNTFTAFLKDSSILLKILPISMEIYEILSTKYLLLNPFERHSLFEFRNDIINVSKLSQSGPLSINCNADFLQSCLIPYDHVENNSNEESIIDYIHSNIVLNLITQSTSSESSTLDDELVITPPNTYPSSPILASPVDNKGKENFESMLKQLNQRMVL